MNNIINTHKEERMGQIIGEGITFDDVLLFRHILK